MPGLGSGKVIFFLFALLILDLTLVPALCFDSFHPVLAYLFVLFGVFESEPRKSLALAAATGLLRDLVGSGPFALEAVILVTLAFSLDRFLTKFDRGAMFTRIASAWVFVYLTSAANIILTNLFRANASLGTVSVSHLAFQTATASALLMPVFFYLISHWFRVRLPLKQYELFK